MLSPGFVIAIAVGYVGLLFVIAYISDRRSRSGKAGSKRRRPWCEDRFSFCGKVPCTASGCTH